MVRVKHQKEKEKKKNNKPTASVVNYLVNCVLLNKNDRFCSKIRTDKLTR